MTKAQLIQDIAFLRIHITDTESIPEGVRKELVEFVFELEKKVVATEVIS